MHSCVSLNIPLCSYCHNFQQSRCFIPKYIRLIEYFGVIEYIKSYGKYTQYESSFVAALKITNPKLDYNKLMLLM